MDVTRQLRLDKLSKGFAPIQNTFCWEGKRLRKSAGEKCRPQDWHDKHENVRASPYAGAINKTLSRWKQAAEEAHQAARLQGLSLDEAPMWAEIQRRYQLLQAEPAAEAEEPDLPPLPVVEATAPPLLAHMHTWIEEQKTRRNLRSGQLLSQVYTTSLANTRRQLQAFHATTGHPLTLESIDHSFYAAFQAFFFQHVSTNLNTFGKSIKQLKTFLEWAVDRDLPVSAKFRRFEAPDVPVGADALTQDELLDLAALDFQSPVVRAAVVRHFTQWDRPAGQTVPTGQRRSQVDELRVRERLRVLETARDKLLQCCYFGLRISDANRLAPRQLRGNLARVKAGKTQVLCLIPYFDDDVFQPVALIEKYAPLRLATCLPVVHNLHDYLPQVAELSGLTRIHLTSKVGRKTFATLKIYQGVPKSQVMLATGHQTESSFNRYLGINEAELVASYQKTARRVADLGGTGKNEQKVA